MVSVSSEKLLFNLSAPSLAHCVTHCVLEGVLGFLGWTALRLRHRRLGGGAVLAGLPSIHLKPGLFPNLKAKKNHFLEKHRPQVFHGKPPHSRHPSPLITSKLEPSHEFLTIDPHHLSSRMVPSFLSSPPAERLAVRVRRKVGSGAPLRQYL